MVFELWEPGINSFELTSDNSNKFSQLSILMIDLDNLNFRLNQVDPTLAVEQLNTFNFQLTQKQVKPLHTLQFRDVMLQTFNFTLEQRKNPAIILFSYFSPLGSLKLFLQVIHTLQGLETVE